jgi:class 3 adenylate cyclase
MITSSNEELVRRVAKLARQNQELEERIKKLEKENERLAGQNEKYKAANQEVQPAAEGSLKFNMATILFADVQRLEKTYEGINSAEVMDELDEIFFEFGSIASRYKIERIKTIGDTFMCAGGIPVKNITNPVDVVMAAMEMRNFLDRYEGGKRGDDKRMWDIRIGIHTGPVTAAVTGRKKVSYDIKGDTVHNASRLESLSEYGSILISVMTYELVKEFFDCEYFGRLPVKYKSDLLVYMVKGLKPEFSVDGRGIMPNGSFKIKFGLIQLTDLQEMILDKLEKELPDFVFYHNVKHTVDVVTEVELIGWAEGCTDEEILLLKTAALFHDTGITESFDEHELRGTEYARKVLPGYGYTPEQIEKICSIIMATRLPPRPASLLEEIICDSDLDYLGRSDFIPVSNTLFEELKAQKKMKDLNEWNKLQVKFISGHQYFTKTARSLREVNKNLQIERIKSLITD